MAAEQGAQVIRTVGRRGIRAVATATAAWRTPPDIVIVGVKRGGTTALFRQLEQHPSMLPLVPSARRLPMRSNMKGVHYFDTNAGRSRRWYLGHFASRPARRRRLRQTGAAFTAEASPYYFFHPLGARRAVLGLPVTTTFVVMLRDPVDRTVSHWAEQTRNGVEQLALADALEAEPARLADSAAKIVSGEIDTSFAHEHQSYLAQSHYAESLQRWIDLAGSDRLLVLFSEAFYADPASTIEQITARVGVAPTHAPTGDVDRNAAPRTSRVDPTLEAELVERLRPDVDEVARILGGAPPWPRFFPSRTAS